MRKLTILVLAVCFFGLAASAQEAAADLQATDAQASKATVYVYRYKQFVGSALSPSVWCDQTELARMENGRYFMVTLDPGKHTSVRTINNPELNWMRRQDRNTLSASRSRAA